jgi:hypothetical protein
MKKIFFTALCLSLLFASLLKAQEPISLASDILISGAYSDAAVSGNYIYALNSYGLMIFEFRDDQLRLVSAYPTVAVSQNPVLTHPGQVIADGDLCFVITSNDSLFIISVEDPASPVRLFSLAFRASVFGDEWRTMATDGNFLFTFADTANIDYKLKIYSLEDPRNLELISSSFLGSYSSNYEFSVVPSQNRLYYPAWNDGGHGMRVNSYANPQRPVSSGFTADGDFQEIGVTGDFLFTLSFNVNANNPPSAIRSYRLTDPDEPERVDTLTLEPDYLAGNMVIDQNRLFLVIDSTLQAVSFTDQGVMELAGGTNLQNTIPCAMIAPNRLVARKRNNLQVLNCEDPDEIETIAEFADTIGRVNNVAVDGNIAYVVTNWDHLRTIDISNPARPHLLGSLQTTLQLGSRYNIAVHNGIAVLPCLREIYFISVVDPANPVLLDSLDSGYYICNVALTDSIAYLAHCVYYDQPETGMITAVSISDPQNVEVLGDLILGHIPGPLLIKDSTAFVGIGAHTLLFSVDISNPREMTVLDSCQTEMLGGALNDLALNTLNPNILYGVGTQSTGVVVFNISNPHEVTLTDSIRIGWDTYDKVSFGNGYLYIAEEHGFGGGKNVSRLRVYSTLNPECSPENLGYYNGLGAYPDLAVKDGFAYIAGTYMFRTLDCCGIIGMNDLTVSSDSVVFGEVQVGDTATFDLEISNNGLTQHLIEGVRVSDGNLSVHPNNRVYLPEGSVRHVAVKYHPQAAGDYQGEIIVSWEHADIHVAVIGRGLPAGVRSDKQTPYEFALDKPFPNPFNSISMIPFSLPKATRARLTVSDATGRLVAVLIDGQTQAGRHQAIWSAEKVSSGLYFIRLEAGGKVAIRKMVLMM